MSVQGLTGEEIAEFFGLKWIKKEEIYEGNHGREETINGSGWAIGDKVIVGSYYNDPGALLGIDATYRLFPLLIEKVKRLEEELDEHIYEID